MTPPVLLLLPLPLPLLDEAPPGPLAPPPWELLEDEGSGPGHPNPTSPPRTNHSAPPPLAILPDT